MFCESEAGPLQGSLRLAWMQRGIDQPLILAAIIQIIIIDWADPCIGVLGEWKVKIQVQSIDSDLLRGFESL